MIKIRKLEPGDEDKIKDFINGIMTDEFSVENSAYAYEDLNNVMEHYGGDRELFLVAEEEDGKVIGTLAIKEDGPDTALLRRVLVDKKYRGKGYGGMLLKQAMDFCFDHNYKNVSFRGTDRMQTALRLCLKNGFEEQDVAEFGDFKLMTLSRKL
ncbi:MAG: GNAT family N-acetyltransferase [Lentisphaerae bacterium]|nr:GNAT family N-acetyltransferase [Lentisphaerota bacterium]